MTTQKLHARWRKYASGSVDETVYVRHFTKEAAEEDVVRRRAEGFEASFRPDGDRWLVTAHRDDGMDDAFSIQRIEAFRRPSDESH
jgi:hypothetical protein